MRRLKIRHETLYAFSGPVQLYPHYLRIRPREGHDLRIESSVLETEPSCSVRWRRDMVDNSVATLSFDTPTNVLRILSELVIQHFNEAPLDFLISDYAVYYPFAYEAEEISALAPYTATPNGQDNIAVAMWLGRHWQPGGQIQTYTLLQRLCEAIHEEFRYQMREEPGVQTPAETLSRGMGSCRDFACLFMMAARSLGLAARFVSGYQHAPIAEQGHGSTHAWTEVFLPGAGWRGFDPTTGKMAGPDHIPTAVSHRPEAVPPIAGSFVGPPGADLKVNVWVNLLDGPPTE